MGPARNRIAAVLVAVALVAVATPLPAAAVTPVATQIEYRWTSATPEPSWLMDGAVHAAVDASGNVYVADTGNSRVQKYAATGRLLKQWGALGYGDGQFDHPTGIAVSPNGKNVYVADTGNNRVQHFDANGTFISRWGRIGGPDLAGSGDGEFNAPSGVAVGPDSKVYVVDKNNARVQRFDAAGKFVSKWGSPGSSDGFFLNPSQIAIDSSGAVYVTDTNCYRVQKFTPGGTFVLKWGAYDRFMVGKGLFRKPIGVAVDKAGHVLVADESTRWIQVFDTHGTWLNQWGGIYNRFDAGFVKPGGAACDPKGNFLIADTAMDRLAVYTAEGRLVKILGSWGVSAGRFDLPAGVAVDKEGNVGVADMKNHRIQKLAPDLKASWSVPYVSYPTPGLKGSEFNLPQGVGFDAVGNLYSCDTKNGRIQKHGLVGEYITQWGSTGTGDGWFQNPTGVAVGPNGHVYVADSGNNRIQEFDGNGAFIRKWGTAGMGNGQFMKPAGIAVATSGDVWVADAGNNRVQRFSSNGVFKAKWGSLGTGPGYMKNPCGIALDANGQVLIADTDNNRIDVFTSGGTFVQAFGRPGSWHGEFNRPTSVAVGPSGEVLVADQGNDRVQRFMPHRMLSISVAGVTTGGAYRSAVLPTVTFYGEDVVSTRVELDGAAWTPGQYVSAEGRHTLWAWAKDATGAQASVTVPFLVDKHAPTTSSNAVASYTDSARITLTASDDVSGVAATYWRLDGGSVHTGSAASAGPGVHTLSFWSKDRAGNVEGARSVSFTVKATMAAAVTRISGADRYLTAVAVSKQGFPAGASAAVVAYGGNFPDALAAAPLARAWRGPLLLTGTSALPSAVLTELKRLAPKRVFIIGATGVVSSHVKDQLVGLPSSPSVTRLGGLDRYDTAAKVAEQVAYKLGAASRAVVVPGADYPCALIAAPLAASKGWPILLTQAQTLPDYTSSCLSRLKVQSVLVVGNTSEVSGSVYSRLPGSKQRIYTDSGDRYATAGLVFDYAKQQGLTPARVALAVGGDFPDALSAGPYLARDGGFLLLTGTNALHPQAQSRLTANKLVVRNLDVIGSTLAISDAAVSQAKAALK